LADVFDDEEPFLPPTEDEINEHKRQRQNGKRKTNTKNKNKYEKQNKTNKHFIL